MAKVAGSQARRAALALLDGVTGDGKMLHEIRLPDGLSGPDRARAARLAETVLRKRGRADAALAGFLRKTPQRRLMNILRLGTVELLSDGAAAHGVVNGAVALARAGRKTAHQAGLVNAVLRRVAESGADAWDKAGPTPLPKWLRKPLVAAYGRQAVAGIEAVAETDPPLDLTLRDGSTAPEGAIEVAPGTLRLPRPGAVTELAGFSDGHWWVQDVAAAQPVRLLGDIAGQSAIDLCAAPGGKTMQLAAAGAKVTAVDVSAARLKRVHQNLARTGLQATVREADVLEWRPPNPADLVLLDAPCSATGTIRRHPDLPLLKGAAQLGELCDLQDRMIDAAYSMLRPGGTLLYCTCSLLPAEGEDRIARALSRHDGLTLQPADPNRAGRAHWINDAGMLRTRPDDLSDIGGMDGFFAAILQRAS